MQIGDHRVEIARVQRFGPALEQRAQFVVILASLFLAECRAYQAQRHKRQHGESEFHEGLGHAILPRRNSPCSALAS